MPVSAVPSTVWLRKRPTRLGSSCWVSINVTVKKWAMMLKYCWADRSDLEVALILVLIVSVPYLIAMIMVYSLSPVYLYSSVSCKNICDSHLLQVSELKKGSGKTRQHVLLKQEVCNGNICENRHPFLVSILDYKYDDDLSEQTYVGAGVLVTCRWVLTSSNIVKKYISEIEHRIQVRAGSNYWSKGGTTADVARIVLADKSEAETIAGLNLATKFLLKINQIFPALLSKTKHHTNNAVYPIYGWNANYSFALRRRHKYVVSIRVDVTAFDTDICPEITKGKNFCARPLHSTSYQPCFYEIGFPLLDQENTLLGIKSGEVCRKNQSVHTYHNTVMYANWIETTTNGQED